MYLNFGCLRCAHAHELGRTTTLDVFKSISGTAQAGQELTAVVTPDLADASYQWYVADTSSGTYTKITNAVKSTYTVPTSKVGKFLKVEATGAGKFSGTVTSAATTVVVAA